MRDWQKVEEIGSISSLKLMAFLLKICPHWLIVCIAYPISFGYWICSKKAREAIRIFSKHLYKTCGKKVNSWKLILSFSITLIEKGESWSNKMKYKYFHFKDDDFNEYEAHLKTGKGAIVFVSHLGSSEQLRAISDEMINRHIGHELPVLSIVDFDGTDKFNNMIKQINPSSMMNLMSIKDIDITSIEVMEDVLSKGGLVIIAGDRSGSKNSKFTFLGDEASFPEGAFLIASLLNYPSFFISSLRTRNFGFRRSYEIFCDKISDGKVIESRKERRIAMTETMKKFVARLENLTIKYPYQWYNFYNFWSI